MDVSKTVVVAGSDSRRCCGRGLGCVYGRVPGYGREVEIFVIVVFLSNAAHVSLVHALSHANETIMGVEGRWFVVA